ncbi:MULTISPECIES: hypothetical protein [Streptomyces]
MKVHMKFSKIELLDNIANSPNLDDYQSKLLSFLMNIDSNFFHYSFSYNQPLANMDYLYSELKSYFMPALLDGNWEFSFGHTLLDEDILIANFTFNDEQLINEFTHLHSRLANDHREKFHVLDIYLSKGEIVKALKQGIIKNSKNYIWYVDGYSTENKIEQKI